VRAGVGVRRTHGRDVEEIEHLLAVLPCVGVSVLRLTLVCRERERERVVKRAEKSGRLAVKAVDLSDLSALVVSAQKRDFVGKARLQCQQSRQRFQRIVPAVHEIALKMAPKE
jgi:hypothetical protein